MKKLITLMALAWTALASAQTFTQGTNALAHNNWWGADTDFTGALASSPTSQDVNALKAMTRLLVLPQTPAGSNFLVALGFSKTNYYQPGFSIGSLPKDANGEPSFPANYNSSTIVAFFRTTIMATLAASDTNFANVTDPNYTLMLSSNETGIEAVTVDYGDIQMLRAMLSAMQFWGYTLNANNFSVVMPQIVSLMENNGFTVQAVLADYSSLLMLSSASDLTASEGALTNAIAKYFAASAFIRNRPPNATNRLFTLDAGEVAKEAQFRADLTNVLLSLNAPTELDTNKISSTIYAGAYFAGTHSLRSLMPQFNGDIYVNGSLPDYTFGGILPYQPAFKTESMLRQEFHSYAGIYAGQVYDITFNDPNAGGFAVFISTNQQATVVGFDGDSFQNYDGQSGGVAAQFNVDKGGSWQFDSNTLAGVSGSGSVGKDGSFYGELDFTNGDSVQLNGNQQSPLGSFQNAAGYYTGGGSGTFGGQFTPFTLSAVVSADGYIIYCVFINGTENDGGVGQFASNNRFTNFVSASGSTVTGTLNTSTFQITGNVSNPDGSGTWTLNRSAKVPFDLPPVITKDLPLSTNVALGASVTFSLTATGSPPLCYQWFLNGNAIPGAISNTLVVSNNLWTTTGTYYISASVNNAADGTNSQQCVVNVGVEITPPTVAITNITAGMLVSNASFTVMGTAADNASVTNVYVSVGNSAFAPASTVNNWANWSALVNLPAGTNTVRAYAVNAGGIHSTTNSVAIVYVLSATLTVQTNGLGSINPNDNGSLLQIGNTYLLTATAGTGFAFTNWTGGTSLPLAVLTNGPALWFTMQSNLVLQANFMDTNKPVVAITNITAGMNVSNALFNVMGTATDNVAVAGVYFSLSNAVVNTAYAPVLTANNWANWNTNLTLIPGTNTVRAYAVDNSGNISPTNSVNLVYVLSAVLTVQTNGLGSINPNDNGSLLQIGNAYLLTATAGTGFAFTNWTGGTSLPLAVLTNGPALWFTMQSNLVLQANFMDTNKPVVAITNITAGMLVSNALFNVMGTATDNVAVAGVYFSLSNAVVNTAYAPVLTANNWANWNTNLTLIPGTNTVRAYAVDSSGNISPTNSVNLVYVLSAVLTVQTNGLGSISPNYNGSLLQIGNTYLLTATAGTGFAFTNWTGGTNGTLAVLTTAPALQFVMQSNLVLQANFMDTNKPVVAITNITAGMNVSNASFTVMGTATDNVAVAGVYFSLSNAVVNTAYAPVLTANNWANWNTNLTLIPGTNTVRAYAVDSSGNISPTNSVNLVYVLSAVLTVQTNGLGSISPNDNGSLLQIGNTYLLTATAGTGFAFTNWTGGTNGTLAVLTTAPALQFVMQSNLVLQANFMDTNKPVVAITNITAGMNVSNASFTVMGTATDNVAVAGVFYSLNNAAFTLASTVNNWARWTAAVNLIAGTNTIAAYAVDNSGNISPTNSVSLVTVLSTALTVHTNGSGTVNPNYNGVLLQIGNAYSMTATAGTGFAFTNWTGGTNGTLAVLTNGPALQFVMQSNLVLQANFMDTNKPVVAITNITVGMLVSNSAFTVMGTASDNVAVSGVLYSLNNGVWTNAVGTASWSAAVTLAAGTNTISAYAVDTSGNVSATNSTSLVLTFQITTAALPMGTNGFPYNAVLSVLGGTSPYTWTNVAGTLPAGLSLSTNGIISGTPTVSATNNLTVQVTDNLGSIANRVLTLIITNAPALQITTTALPNGTNGVAYNQTLGATGGHPSYSWTRTTGSLPAGLSLATNGVISGMPAAGTYSFTVKVTDAVFATKIKPLTLVVITNAAPIRPTLNAASYFSGNQFRLQINGVAGQNYTLEMATNLDSPNWVPILVTNAPGGSFFITDPNATNIGCFYRIRVGP